MELHICIRKVIDEFGIGIISEERFVNILADYQAFDATATKTIVRALVRHGYGEKLHNLDRIKAPDKDLKVKSYVSELTNMGYQSGYVEYVFDCFSYALGWKNEAPVIEAEEAATFEFNERDFTVHGVSFTMIFVEGGSFSMGATPDQDIYAAFDEKPCVEVSVSDFYIGKMPVTQQLWQAVMNDNPSHNRGDNLPVERVTWHECQEFIARLNRMTGVHFRLPTEAEWEFAARGGKYSKHTRFAGANDSNYDTAVWCNDNSDGHSHEVGLKSANELGLHDMSGNVAEWCQDWYFNSYSISAGKDNPQGPTSGTLKVMRGGSWGDKKMNCRVSKRSSLNPNYRSKLIGLRIAL